MSFDPDIYMTGTEEERNAALLEEFKFSLLADLRGDQFLRLLNLARTEGLLAELLQLSDCERYRVFPSH